MNVLITGAAGGLGRALAVECGRRGYNLFLTDVNGDGLRCIQRGLERQFGVTVTTKACGSHPRRKR
jgi:short-subunit dehydrogenase